MKELLPFDEALGRLLDAARPLPPERRSLAAAVGRVLAEDIAADRDFPPGPRSAMDGFAVRSPDAAEAGARLRIRGELPAGRPAAGLAVGPGEAIRVFTGSVVPEGADAVVMVELTEEDPAGDRVLVRERVTPGQHVRARAEDRRAGERVVRSGAVLRPAEIAAVSAVGRTEVLVHRAPSVGVLATGDEVVDTAAVPEPHQVRNSNLRSLLAALDRSGFPAEDLGIARDDRDALAAAMERGFRHDVLVVTGGVSVGAYDLVREVLESAGTEVLFHGVAMRPGKPVLAGRRGAGLVVGLPGNPVSASIVFEVLVTPALRRMAGHVRPVRPWIPARLTEPLRRKPGRRTFAPAEVAVTSAGLEARPVPSRGSGDLLSLVRSNAVLDVSPGAHALPAGTVLPALLLGEPIDWQDSGPRR